MHILSSLAMLLGASSTITALAVIEPKAYDSLSTAISAATLLPNLHVYVKGANSSYDDSVEMANKVRARTSSLSKRAKATIQVCSDASCEECRRVCFLLLS